MGHHAVTYKSVPDWEPHGLIARLSFEQQHSSGTAAMYTILIIILIIALIGALPTWGYSRGWGYVPSGGLGLVLVILIILVLMGRI